MAGARVTSNLNAVTELIINHADRAVLAMVVDIHAAATRLAPHLTGALQQSGRINRKGKAHYSVSFGDSRVPYARRRHFENKLHPETLYYLERPGDAITKAGIGKYWRST